MTAAKSPCREKPGDSCYFSVQWGMGKGGGSEPGLAGSASCNSDVVFARCFTDPVVKLKLISN